MTIYLHVALPVPLRDTFTYSYSIDERRIDEKGVVEASQQAQPGARVLVEFGTRELVGVIVDTATSTALNADKIKPISSLIDDHALLPQELLQLCRWASQYYLHPLGEVINAALPQRYREGRPRATTFVYAHTKEGLGLPDTALKGAAKQHEIHARLLYHGQLCEDEFKTLGLSGSALKALIAKGIVAKNAVGERPATPPPARLLREPPKALNAEQQSAFDQIRYHNYACYLLDGATGSGKTEVYLQVIARVLQSGKQALVLIPEIGLTPQTISRFCNRFNVAIAELHSNVAEAARARAWESARSGEAGIVIGTRLASLAPFHKLGVIVIDEEHDRSYKQQDGFKYSARDLSVFRARALNIPVILGSATPSLESLLNVTTKKYQTLRLRRRAGGAREPTIVTVDLRQQETLHGLTSEALAMLRRTLAQDEQAIVFVNRRGYAPSLICHACGWSADCASCDVRLTVHSQPYHLRCHYCDRSSKVPRHCPQCGAKQLNTAGLGTEQLEQNLQKLFPQTPVLRIDRDSTRQKGSLQNKLLQSQNAGACIFVGTQMLAKGHHLARLTLVIIVDADQGLLGPDFRSVEQMGQLITQVAGRAGREQAAGQVMVQTHRPDHPLLKQLLEFGYATFARELLAQRKSAKLPPYWYVAFFRAESKRAENSLNFLSQARSIIEQQTQGLENLTTLGPHPSAIEKINDRYRYALQVSCASRNLLQRCLRQALPQIEQLALARRTRWSLDIDSLNPA